MFGEKIFHSLRVLLVDTTTVKTRVQMNICTCLFGYEPKKMIRHGWLSKKQVSNCRLGEKLVKLEKKKLKKLDSVIYYKIHVVRMRFTFQV